MVIFGTVINEQQDLRSGQAFNEAVEDGLRPGVDPVQVLEDETDRLQVTFPEEEVLERGEHPLPALRRVQIDPGRIIDFDVQKTQDRGKVRLQSPVRSQEPVGDDFTDSMRIVLILDLEVILEELDGRSVGHGLAVRGGGVRFQRKPTGAA